MTFSLRTRAKQASLATAGNWLGNFLIGFLTPFANDGTSYAFGFVLCGCSLAAGIIIYFFLYETKSLSLENVNTMYSDGSVKAVSSSKWVPTGYFDRMTRDHAYFQRRTSVLDDLRNLPPTNEDIYVEEGRSDEEKSTNGGTPGRRSIHGGPVGNRRWV